MPDSDAHDSDDSGVVTTGEADNSVGTTHLTESSGPAEPARDRPPDEADRQQWSRPRRRPRFFSAESLRRRGGRLATLVLVGLFAYFALSVVQVLAAARTSQQPYAVGHSTFIVVMGEHSPTAPISADTRARLDQALSLLQAGAGKKIVLGVLPGGVLGPSAEARLLARSGASGTDLVELKATSDDSLLAAVRVLAGSHSVIIVSDPLNDLRLRGDAASYGLGPEMSPASPSGSGPFGDVLTTGQQAFAVALGRVFGFSTTGWASS